MHRLAVVPPLLLISMSAACSSSHPAHPVAPVSATPGKPQCRFAVRRVSLPGRAGVRPQVAVTGDTFAVAWEEEGEARGVRVAVLDANARPLAAPVSLTEPGSVGTDPRIVADGLGGFVVFWTVAGDDLSAIEMRRLDAQGQPRGQATEVLRAPGARALAAARAGDGFVVVWWNWNGTPHTLAATFLDGEGHASGRALPLTDAPSADPTVDIAAPADVGVRSSAAAIVTWEQLFDGVQHVEVGQLDDYQHQLTQLRDLGRGESPALGHQRVIFERAEEMAVYSAPVDGAATKLVDGHTPAAARRGDATALCFIRDTTMEEGRADELWCGDLVDGRLPDGTRVALAPRGLLALQLAAGASQFAVAYQVQEEDDTSISFAALACPASLAGRRMDDPRALRASLTFAP